LPTSHRPRRPTPSPTSTSRPSCAARALSIEELQQHIADCNTLWQRSYALYQEHGNPSDRDDAVLWLYRRDEARASLPKALQDAREAEIWADIFMDQGARDRVVLAGGRR
jgi:hypothetical protein